MKRNWIITCFCSILIISLMALLYINYINVTPGNNTINVLFFIGLALYLPAVDFLLKQGRGEAGLYKQMDIKTSTKDKVIAMLIILSICILIRPLYLKASTNFTQLIVSLIFVESAYFLNIVFLQTPFQTNVTYKLMLGCVLLSMVSSIVFVVSSL